MREKTQVPLQSAPFKAAWKNDWITSAKKIQFNQSLELMYVSSPDARAVPLNQNNCSIQKKVLFPPANSSQKGAVRVVQYTLIGTAASASGDGTPFLQEGERFSFVVKRFPSYRPFDKERRLYPLLTQGGYHLCKSRVVPTVFPQQVGKLDTAGWYCLMYPMTSDLKHVVEKDIRDGAITAEHVHVLIKHIRRHLDSCFRSRGLPQEDEAGEKFHLLYTDIKPANIFLLETVVEEDAEIDISGPDGWRAVDGKRSEDLVQLGTRFFTWFLGDLGSFYRAPAGSVSSSRLSPIQKTFGRCSSTYWPQPVPSSDRFLSAGKAAALSRFALDVMHFSILRDLLASQPDLQKTFPPRTLLHHAKSDRNFQKFWHVLERLPDVVSAERPETSRTGTKKNRHEVLDAKTSYGEEQVQRSGVYPWRDQENGDAKEDPAKGGGLWYQATEERFQKQRVRQILKALSNKIKLLLFSSKRAYQLAR
mmetsp:Transcript_3859/g.5908  ORF Transcript_3859/g.5908 Transcript_3859/m.5908 type:complete len:476 (-) Transcript_3859:335-1762(-)